LKDEDFGRNIMKIIDISKYSNENVSIHPLYFYGNKLFTLQHDATEYKSKFGIYDINSGTYKEIIPKYYNYYPVFLRNGLIYLYLKQSLNDSDIIGCVLISEKDYENKEIANFEISKSKKYSSFGDIFKVVKVFMPSRETLFICINNVKNINLLFLDMVDNYRYQIIDSLVLFESISDIELSHIANKRNYIFKTGGHKLPYEKKDDWIYFVKNEQSKRVNFDTYEEAIVLVDEGNLKRQLEFKTNIINCIAVEKAFNEAAIDYLGIIEDQIFYLLLNFKKKNELICYDIFSGSKIARECAFDEVKLITVGERIYFYNVYESKAILYEINGNNCIKYPQELGHCLGVLDKFLITQKVLDSTYYIYSYDLEKGEVYSKHKGSGQLFSEIGFLVIY
jgi:hypothetical protein